MSVVKAVGAELTLESQVILIVNGLGDAGTTGSAADGLVVGAGSLAGPTELARRRNQSRRHLHRQGHQREPCRPTIRWPRQNRASLILKSLVLFALFRWCNPVLANQTPAVHATPPAFLGYPEFHCRGGTVSTCFHRPVPLVSRPGWKLHSRYRIGSPSRSPSPWRATWAACGELRPT